MATKQSISKAQYQMLAEFRFALRQFIRFSEDSAQTAGITPQQHQALLAIKGFPGRDHASVGELAQRLQLRHHSVVGLIDRLVAENLVVREVSQEDRRRVDIHLTDQGERVLEKLSAAHRQQLRRMMPELGRLLQSLGSEDK